MNEKLGYVLSNIKKKTKFVNQPIYLPKKCPETKKKKIQIIFVSIIQTEK